MVIERGRRRDDRLPAHAMAAARRRHEPGLPRDERVAAIRAHHQRAAKFAARRGHHALRSVEAGHCRLRKKLRAGTLRLAAQPVVQHVAPDTARAVFRRSKIMFENPAALAMNGKAGGRMMRQRSEAFRQPESPPDHPRGRVDAVPANLPTRKRRAVQQRHPLPRTRQHQRRDRARRRRADNDGVVGGHVLKRSRKKGRREWIFAGPSNQSADQFVINWVM